MKASHTEPRPAPSTAPPPRATRILLVDDHPIVRERLAQVIQDEPDLAICGEAEDRKQALQVIAATEPHLVIVDLMLKDSHGLELIKDIAATHPQVAMLVVSLHDESLYAERVIRAGAKGYITKQEATRDILVAIRRVLAGEVYLSQRATDHMAKKLLGRASNKAGLFIDRLTDRELQVFEEIGKGLRTKDIANTLGVNVTTIETHRARIKDKLQIMDAAELRRQAVLWKGRLSG